MEVTIEETGACRRELHISIPADEVRKEYNDTLKLFIQSASIPGFRKGKAPRQMVEGKYKKDILKELKDQLVPKSYQKAVQEHEIDVVQVVSVPEVDLILDQPFSFVVTMDIAPEFDIPDYQQIPVSIPKLKISKEMEDGAIGRMQEDLAQYDNITDRPIQEGDMVCVDFNATLDGTPLKEVDEKATGLSEAKDFWVMMNEEAVLPEFRTELEGKEIGDELSFEANVDHLEIEALKGKPITIQCVVKTINQKTPAPIEKLFTFFEVDNETSLREHIKQTMTLKLEEQRQQAIRGKIGEYLLEHAEFDLPETLVNEYTMDYIESTVMSNKNKGITDEQIKEHQEEIYSSANEDAKRTVKMNFILNKIADKENIKLTRQELNAEFENIGKQHGLTAHEVKNRLMDNGRLLFVEQRLIGNKMMDFLAEKALVTETEE